MILYCDLETFSATPIKCGPSRYAEDPQAKILLWGYAIDDQPAKVWDVTSTPIPADLLNAIRTVQSDPESRHVWHNGINFDTVFIDRVMPDLAMPIDRICDTMLIAYQHGLPGALGDLSLVYKLPVDKAKDRDGARLIRLFCQPRFDGTFSKADHPEDWTRFVNYCRLDVEAERAIYKKLPKINCTEAERRLMVLDAEINRRGMLMDVELARKAVAATEQNSNDLRDKTASLTEGQLDSATRTQATLKFIKDKWGYELENLRKSEVERLIQQEELPEPMRELLRVRLGAAKASVKKFQGILDCVCVDNRLRGCLQFRGASRTGRWSGRMFQPQNLPRPGMKDDDINLAITAIKGGYVDLLFSDVGAAAADTLRGAIIVPEGKRMVVADYSNIEGRVLAWVAGERWKIKAFEAFDAGTGPDLYKLTYSRSFNTDVTSVTKPQRQMGKVLELAMGYGGGCGAFVTFANGYGIDLHDLAKAVLPVVPADVMDEAKRAYAWACEEPARLVGLDENVWLACDSVKRLWRRANPNICQLWNSLDEACAIAITEKCPVKVRKGLDLTVSSRGSWLLIRLPSGRHLCYPQARIGSEDEGCTFSYMGVNQMTRKWMRIKTYGGKCCENIIQAIACDVLANSLFNIVDAGFSPILSVHDEVLTEAPDDPEHDYPALERAMEILPMWATGLPLAAAGFSSYRYRK